VAFHSARAFAHTRSDDFRLSNANMWTEPRHSPAGGSIQIMRLSDGLFRVAWHASERMNEIYTHRELAPLRDAVRVGSKRDMIAPFV
jgi:hypothetical protein